MKTSALSLLRPVCVATLAALATLTALAQVAPPTPSIPPPGLQPEQPDGIRNNAVPMPDRKAERFVSKVSILHTEESTISSITSQRTANDQLRSFADRLRDSTAAREQELAQLAQSRNIILPTGRESGDLAEESADWQKKDPKDLDKDYVDRIIRIQKSAIDTLQDYARDDDSDPELAAFAQKHLSTLRDNLLHAENLERQLD